MTIQLDDTSIHSLRYGDEKSSREIFEKLHEGYAMALIIYGRNRGLEDVEAQDLAADALLELWRCRHRMSSSVHIRRFLYRVLLNRIINYQGKKAAKKKYEHWKMEVEGSMDPAENPIELAEEATAEEIQISLIMDELHKWEATDMAEGLPEDHKRIFILKYFNRWSGQQIANELGIDAKTVSRKCHLAIKYLRKMAGIKK